ncbi:uncharacterized protein SPSK_10918 [Sporothrix schenckii 1099-18]|uniref:Uncharacterized protein n=1 Tax=Sporothrix schenckii 1099-18 TaxID=1397361 RepID=A0A0F2M779_SPOSC|nr:uncharacterized protein SPSK_10918 [Sporothrix schenckii 1099-18]KJR85543.1 hypothetical protein SPSK_10918 [Sporothrix schenckii 1099-18]
MAENTSPDDGAAGTRHRLLDDRAWTSARGLRCLLGGRTDDSVDVEYQSTKDVCSLVRYCFFEPKVSVTCSSDTLAGAGGAKSQMAWAAGCVHRRRQRRPLEKIRREPTRRYAIVAVFVNIVAVRCVVVISDRRDVLFRIGSLSR